MIRAKIEMSCDACTDTIVFDTVGEHDITSPDGWGLRRALDIGSMDLCSSCCAAFDLILLDAQEDLDNSILSFAGKGVAARAEAELNPEQAPE